MTLGADKGGAGSDIRCHSAQIEAAVDATERPQVGEMRATLTSLMIGMCIIACGNASPSEAQAKRDDKFGVGASLRQVLAAWGEPEERVVRAVKQELVWNYKGGARVIFKNGKVSSFRTGEVERQIQVKRAVEVESVKKVDADSEESRDILRDMVREIPSGPDGSSSGGAASPSGDPNYAGLIPNAVPPQRRGAGIAPGVVVPSIEEETDETDEADEEDQ